MSKENVKDMFAQQIKLSQLKEAILKETAMKMEAITPFLLKSIHDQYLWEDLDVTTARLAEEFGTTIEFYQLNGYFYIVLSDTVPTLSRLMDIPQEKLNDQFTVGLDETPDNIQLLIYDYTGIRTSKIDDNEYKTLSGGFMWPETHIVEHYLLKETGDNWEFSSDERGAFTARRAA